MNVRHFADRLKDAVEAKGTPVLVGIDPRPGNLPPGFLGGFPRDRAGMAAAFEAFGREVLDVVAPLAPAVKFQAAFYEEYGPEGFAALHASANLARERGLIVIIDGKRNDIGTTAEAYARAYLGKVRVGEGDEIAPWDADALTINPYLGGDGIAPFVEVAAREGNGAFALVRTSNASAGDFQDLVCEGRPLYRHVADRIASWAAPQRGESGYSLLGAVVGATYPGQLAELREAMPGVLFLVPGFGAQGGTARDVAPAFDAEGFGAIVNNSRGLTFAYERPDLKARHGKEWQAAIEQATREMTEALAEHTPAGRLRKP